MAADTIAEEAAVAVIAAAEVTQMAADKTAELKVATAAKAQVLSPLCCSICTHPHKHTRTHKNIHASARAQRVPQHTQIHRSSEATEDAHTFTHKLNHSHSCIHKQRK